MKTDRVEREIRILAPIERVWAVLTESDPVGTWFGNGNSAETGLRPAGVMVLDQGGCGTYPTRIVQVDPPRLFSYRWTAAFPGVPAAEENSTLVEFTLESVGGATLLRVAESGFDELAIPTEREQSAGFKSHADGRTVVLETLGECDVGRDVSPPTPADVTVVDDLFRALAGPTRRDLLDRLSVHGRSAATLLADEMPISCQAVVQHLTRARRGRTRVRSTGGSRTPF